MGQDVARKFIFARTNIDPGAVEAGLTISRYVILAIGIAIVFNILGLTARVNGLDWWRSIGGDWLWST